ncbi:MAG: hypothetical protein ACK6DA_10705 [Candidatus Kapaibacterium sp.]|jgi:hypothetical protein
MVFKELAVGDLFTTNNNQDIVYKKIEPQKRNPRGCGCDKVNAENTADNTRLKFSDFMTVQKI